MREGLWKTKKGGPTKSKNMKKQKKRKTNNPKNSKNILTNPKISKQIPKNLKLSKNGIWEVGEAVRNGAQAFFPW